MFERHASLFAGIREYATHLAGRASSRPIRVLVVDDDDATRNFVDRVLREAGFETAVAADGLAALSAAQEFTPLDLVLTDLVMPGMAGDELVRRLRKIEPTVKVLYLTGYSDELFRDRPSLWEDEAYLDKPCSAMSLLQAVALLSCGRLSVHGRAPASAPATDKPVASAI